MLEIDPESRNIIIEIEKEFAMKGSKHVNFRHELTKNRYNFTKETLKAAAEMYIYLNLCPKFLLNWMKFYIDLLQNAPTDVIIQTLNRIMITGKTKKDRTIFEFSKNIFMKMTNKLSLQYQTIEHFSKGFQVKGTALVKENIPENTTINLNELNFETNIGIIKKFKKKY